MPGAGWFEGHVDEAALTRHNPSLVRNDNSAVPASPFDEVLRARSMIGESR